MPDTTADRLAAYLAEVRQELSAASPSLGFGAEDFDWARHVPALLGAVEAVLALADKLEPQAPPSSALEEDRMWIRQECAAMIREAYAAKLLSLEKDGTDEH